MVNVPTNLINLKTKVNYLDVGKPKTVPADMKKISEVVNKQVAQNTKVNTIKTKVNDLDKKILYATSLIHINQYNTDKQNLEKKFKDADKK